MTSHNNLHPSLQFNKRVSNRSLPACVFPDFYFHSPSFDWPCLVSLSAIHVVQVTNGQSLVKFDLSELSAFHQDSLVYTTIVFLVLSLSLLLLLLLLPIFLFLTPLHYTLILVLSITAKLLVTGSSTVKVPGFTQFSRFLLGYYFSRASFLLLLLDPIPLKIKLTRQAMSTLDTCLLVALLFILSTKG